MPRSGSPHSFHLSDEETEAHGCEEMRPESQSQDLNPSCLVPKRFAGTRAEGAEVGTETRLGPRGTCKVERWGWLTAAFRVKGATGSQRKSQIWFESEASEGMRYPGDPQRHSGGPWRVKPHFQGGRVTRKHNLLRIMGTESRRALSKDSHAAPGPQGPPGLPAARQAQVGFAEDILLGSPRRPPVPGPRRAQCDSRISAAEGMRGWDLARLLHL